MGAGLGLDPRVVAVLSRTNDREVFGVEVELGEGNGGKRERGLVENKQ